MITYPGISPIVPVLMSLCTLGIGFCVVWSFRSRDAIGRIIMGLCFIFFVISLIAVYDSILETVPTYYPSESKTCYIILDKDGNPAFKVFGVNDESPPFESIQVDLKKCFPKD